jgi:nanoRNase/pAp phosphatase (c-di-AMP/oligoRNAs hydrolase)
VRGIDGANGGGHRVASGASVPASELGTFLERIKEELRRQKGP